MNENVTTKFTTPPNKKYIQDAITNSPNYQNQNEEVPFSSSDWSHHTPNSSKISKIKSPSMIPNEANTLTKESSLQNGGKSDSMFRKHFSSYKGDNAEELARYNKRINHYIRNSKNQESPKNPKNGENNENTPPKMQQQN